MYRLELTVFEGVDRSELSMIEVAHAILEQNGEVMAFSDLVNELQNYLGKEDHEIREQLPQFYTDLNIDGSFISLGDNHWGLRSWYPIDSIDEEVSNFNDDLEDEDEAPRRKKKRKKVNAFLGFDDEDAIDYNDDDPEDTELVEDEEEEIFDDDDDDDETKEIADYDSDLSEIEVDSEEVDETSGLSIVDEDDLDTDFDDEDEEE